MDEIFQKLQLLPNTTFLDADFHEITNLISILSQKNIETFEQELKKQEIKLNPLMLNYVAKWFDLVSAISRWEEDVISIWYKKNPRKLFGNDEFMPLTMELLPDDLPTLTQAEKKLSQALKIETGDITNFLLVNLHSATSIKLEEAEKKISPATFQIDPNVLNVVREIRLLDQIERLKRACKDYILFLSEKLNGKPINKDALTAEEEDTFINAFLTTLQLESASEKANCFLERYKLIGDMYLTLIRPDTDSEQKLTEFVEKFFHHIKILKENKVITIPLPKVGNLHFDFKVFANPLLLFNNEAKLIEKISQLVYKMDCNTCEATEYQHKTKPSL